MQRAVCSVGEPKIDSTLGIMRKQRASYQDVVRPAANDDVVMVDFAGTHRRRGLRWRQCDRLYVYARAGSDAAGVRNGRERNDCRASKIFPLTFPSDYSATQLAGKTVEFTVTLKKVQQPVLPEVDAEFARSLGIADGDLGKMRAEIKANLEREVGTRLKNRTRDSAMAALLASTQFDVPKALVDDDKQRLAEMARKDLTARGVPADKELPLDLFAAQAERRVRLGLLVGEVVRAHGLQPRPDQIRKLVEDMAQSYEKPQEVINWYLSDRKRLAELEGTALEDNVSRWVLEQAKVVETPVAFDELMGHRQT